MSAISTNSFATGFPAASPPNEPSAAEIRGKRQLPAATDSFAPTAAFPTVGNGDVAADFVAVPGGSDGSTGLSGFESIIDGFIKSLQSLLASLGQSFGLGGTASSAPTSTPAGKQTYFSRATAGSVGDPHESFDGTTGSGGSVDGKWDSTTSHGDLLSSDSFDGGYRVSTSVTAPNANGVTLNESATVTTYGGNASVSLKADGSYDVRSSGNTVSLTTGKGVSLDNGETVTLDSDESLTVRDTNASGGTISTTLRSNGDGGVDVSTTAKTVDLGGYLVNRNEHDDGDGNGPARYRPLGMTNDPYASDQYASAVTNDGPYLA